MPRTLWPSPRRQSYHRRVYHARRARDCEQGSLYYPPVLRCHGGESQRLPAGRAVAPARIVNVAAVVRSPGQMRDTLGSSSQAPVRPAEVPLITLSVPALLSGKGYLLESPGPLSEARLSSCRASHKDAPVAEGTNSALPGPRTGPGEPALHPTLSHPTSGAQLRSPGGSPCNAARFR